MGERYEKVLNPKVQGVINLHEATLGDRLDCFVLFSSMASVMGNLGKAIMLPPMPF